MININYNLCGIYCTAYKNATREVNGVYEYRIRNFKIGRGYGAEKSCS